MTWTISLAILGWIGFGWMAYKFGVERAERENAQKNGELHARNATNLALQLDYINKHMPDQLREKLDAALQDRGIT